MILGDAVSRAAVGGNYDSVRIVHHSREAQRTARTTPSYEIQSDWYPEFEPRVPPRQCAMWRGES